MEVKKGYKQTDIGVIPNDWEVKQMKDVCKLINGRGFKPHEWKKEGLPIIRIQNLNGSDEYNYYQGQYNNKIVIEDEQLLFAWSGSRGTSFGPHVWKGDKALLNYHTWKVNVFENKIDSSFFFHRLKQITKEIEDSAHGASALVHTQKWEMEGFKISIPKNKKEQSAIAEVLTETDSLIASLEKLISKKEAVKKGTMQQLLTGKRRLPGFSKEWQTKKLYQIAEIQKGQLITEKEAGQGFIPVIAGGIKPSYFHTKSNRTSNTITISASGANAGYVAIHKYPIFASDCSTIENSKNYNIDFLFFALKEKQIVITKLQTGGAQPHVYPEHLKRLILSIPEEMEEQEQIAKVLMEMTDEIKHLQEKLEKYKVVKQGLMQNLLTGKIRLV